MPPGWEWNAPRRAPVRFYTPEQIEQWKRDQVQLADELEQAEELRKARGEED
jgi:hypothetical protein